MIYTSATKEVLPEVLPSGFTSAELMDYDDDVGHGVIRIDVKQIVVQAALPADKNMVLPTGFTEGEAVVYDIQAQQKLG